MTALNNPPADGPALDALLQTFIAGVSGLPGSLVRPRWQYMPPTQPTLGTAQSGSLLPPGQPSVQTDWCAFGVTDQDGPGFPFFQHVPVGLGTDTMIRFKTLAVKISFIGPNAGVYAEVFRDGCVVNQNWETLQANSIGYAGVEQAIAVPELTNAQWIRQYDVTLRLSRIVQRTYQVETVIEAVGTVYSDDGLIVEGFDVTSTPPPP